VQKIYKEVIGFELGLGGEEENQNGNESYFFHAAMVNKWQFGRCLVN
jgi:hypothetical protein